MSVNVYEIIENSLKQFGYPVMYRNYEGKARTYVTYFEMNNFDDDYSDNEAETEVHSLQIDLFSKDDINQIKNNIKNALKVYFNGVTMVDLTEANNCISHICFRCYFYENREE
jgi:hypothetical protein